MFLTSSWIIDLLLLLSTIVFLLYRYSIRNFGYWAKRGVHNPKPIPFLGNISDISYFRTTIGEWLKKIYDSTNDQYFGIFVFDTPFLVVKNPDLIKNILVKDFNYFVDRTIAAPSHDELFSNMMFAQKSPNWKSTRSKMSPVFSSGKMKSMFPLMNKIGEKLNDYIGKHLGDLEGKEVCAKYSTEVIAKCAFGINAHCFDEENAVFRQIGKSIFDFTLRNAVVQTSFFFRPEWVKIFRMSFVPKWVLDYLKKTFFDVMNEREKSKVVVNDLIDILINLKKNKEFCEDVNFEGDKIVAQAVQFFIAGFETTASTISFTLYEFCMNPQIQNRVRSEMMAIIKKHGGITYEGINEMKYLDMCIYETLRKYPVLPFLDRLCNENYTLPGTNLIVEKGMHVYIPMLGLHYDEKYFPEPQKYIPERFKSESSQKDSSVYMPFGSGPRYCIGSRFGLTATKIGLIHIISHYEVEKMDATPKKIEFEPRSFILQSKVGIPMKFKNFLPSPA